MQLSAAVREAWPLLAVALPALLGALVLRDPYPQSPAIPDGQAKQLASVRRADFASYSATPAARLVADWAIAFDGAADGPFVIVDKVAATIYVFGPNGRLQGAAPVLLGAAIGDETVPGIGERPIDNVLPEERTTPAGRFVGEPGRNARGEDVVWVDYDAAVSMHRVITFNPAERRIERLQTPTVEDNRVSYGCINIPADFYDAYVRPTFAERNAVIYVLPEVKSVTAVFEIHDAVAGQHSAPMQAALRP